MEIYPSKKEDECDLLANLMSDKELIELAVEHGMEESVVKKSIK